MQQLKYQRPIEINLLHLEKLKMILVLLRVQGSENIFLGWWVLIAYAVRV